MEKIKPKPMTAYERRKVTEQRKKAQGLTKKAYYQNQKDIELVSQVKEQLQNQGEDCTNDEAVAHIFDFYRKNAL